MRGGHAAAEGPLYGRTVEPLAGSAGNTLETKGRDVLHIFVDGDACPVREEVYRVARRYHLEVTVAANAWMRVPEGSGVRLKVVGHGFDAADDWIAEHVEADDVVVTADVLLASRCVKKGARVLAPDGRRFTEDNIGEAVAVRNMLEGLRSAGAATGGPPPLRKRDRSCFLHRLDETVQAIRRKHGPGPS